MISRLNFKRAVLSKRKIQALVDQEVVDNWSDPRLSTVQGCLRRGLRIDVIKKFVLSQGLGTSSVEMEWDKLNSENERAWDKVAPRYLAVFEQGAVRVNITNFEAVYGAGCAQATKVTPKLPKDKDGAVYGMKVGSGARARRLTMFYKDLGNFCPFSMPSLTSFVFL